MARQPTHIPPGEYDEETFAIIKLVVADEVQAAQAAHPHNSTVRVYSPVQHGRALAATVATVLKNRGIRRAKKVIDSVGS